MPKYVLSRDGYNDLLREYKQAVKLYIDNEDKTLKRRIKEYETMLDSSKIIKIKRLKNNQININEEVSLIITYNEKDIEKVTHKLVAKETNLEEKDLSINTPLGRAIFKKEVGKTITYKVKNHKVKVLIESKIE